MQNTIKYNTFSTNIQIFPIANRPIYDPMGGLSTEYNWASLLNRLLDVDSFVITKCDALGYINNDASLYFNIHGYVIQLENISDITAKFLNYDKIWAHIKIQTHNTYIDALGGETQEADYLDGLDTDVTSNGTDYYTGYTGVAFSNSNSISGYTHALQILLQEEIDGVLTGKWTIPQTSKLKFITNKEGNSRSVSIDDGILITKTSAAT